MFKRGITAVAVLFFVGNLFSQGSIQSFIFDSKNGMPIEMATVRLLRQSDSSLVQGVQTDIKGSFSLSKVKPGDYVLVLSNVGYDPQKLNIQMRDRDMILRNIQLVENVHALKDLDVKGTAAQLVVKGDTLEYNATAFKTEENAVVEDLLKRLPGVEVSTDGKITVNGEEVKKIRVDGKKFFDGDMEMATKNLPAEMIEKVQVLEQKSDMAQLTGFEDDDTERIINLTTRPNRRKGLFGNVRGGLGADMDNNMRYDANANLNIMEGEAQTSIVAGANNINNSRSSRGRRNFGSVRSGVTETENLGVNNNTIINPNFKIGGDASVNHTHNYSESESNKESYLLDAVYVDSTYNRSENDSYEANMRLEVELKFDSLSTLILQPNLNYNKSNGNSYRDYIYQLDDDTTSLGFSNNTSLGSSVSGGLRLIYNQKFLKPGRSMTFNLYTGFNQSNDDNFNFSRKYSEQNTLIDQFTANKSERLNLDARVSYIEPLWSVKHLLETSLSYSSSSQTSDKSQYSALDSSAYFRLNPEDYTVFVAEYSNNFTNNFNRQSVEFNYQYVDQAYNLMLGIKGEPSQLYSTTVYGDGSERKVSSEVFNFAPTARFRYNMGRKKFVRLDYRGNTQQPSVNQMQPVKNNSDLMRETVGNPTLVPAFNNNIRLMYSIFNEKSFSSFSTMMGANFTKDALVSNSVYDASGKQYNQTVNSNEIPINYFGNLMFNTPIIQKRLHFNTATSGGYNLRYGYSSKGVNLDLIDIEDLILGDISKTRSYDLTEQMSLTFTHDVIELGASGRLRYANSLNNLRNQVVETYDWSARGNFVLRLPYKFNISSDLNFSNRLGYSSFDQEEWIWNASIDKTLFNNKGVISVKWTDILQQQLNIRQTVGENYISYNSYNTLGSYFLVSFSYKINKFNANSSENDFRTRRGMGRFEPGERPYGNRGGGDPSEGAPSPMF